MTETAEAGTRTPAAWSAPDVIPCMSYQDAPAMLDWLEKAFGFERHAVYEDDSGRIEHAEMRAGSGMIMCGSSDPAARMNWRNPGELGGVTNVMYMIVADPDGLFERARAAGAEILEELNDKPYGSRDFSCRDPEGYVWTFGTYRPTSENAQSTA